ncbi:histidinol-phosphatase HisJ [Chrysiogenes arsenatis]|uniref:histidinol-phosphatase HisJ n=1 Tax=Chrysiogenes arsenatis TaxID=309797 RepID=UPI00041BE34C|nr:histidinol-phosphatase HisJ [Chrysiogenes arsenatis]
MQDWHVHSGFCPHGSGRSTEEILLERMEQGATLVGFAEHAPFPEGCIDPSPLRDSAIRAQDVEPYLDEVERLREKYAARCDVRIGFEFDYLPGYETTIQDFIDRYGHRMDHALLSLHCLHDRCVDFSAAEMKRLLDDHFSGNVVLLYHDYYQTLARAIRSPWRFPFPVAIGHFDLVKKFRPDFPIDPAVALEAALPALEALAGRGLTVEINTSGLKKPCQEIYPTRAIIAELQKRGVRLQYGSDTH